ncbi:type II toxin-antitoxin system VapC family toxin [Baekduia sp.]|jgi:PIN domain nuclease of toxin-antitoxin system|uniref:type II toxin-antitoxin system VapC family toxin n=1 Tax=Baekduia sp. TaxID=2600305 RepID=UPI002DFD8EA2|nr:type II toxin-antitoxin system VapC family toxin [Baekduia sp.]
MRVLPDSHALLWWLKGSRQLTEHAQSLMEDDANPFLFSAVTIWELRMKEALGKLDGVDDLNALYEPDLVTLLPITHDHAKAAAALPLHHRDPFDRMLIAQAQLEDAVILTADRRFTAYDVRTAW